MYDVTLIEAERSSDGSSGLVLILGDPTPLCWLDVERGWVSVACAHRLRGAEKGMS